MGRYDDPARTKKALMPHPNGTNVAVVLRKVRVYPQTNFITYTATAADHFWTLANHYYKDTLNWWVLADMNPAVICPDDLASLWGVKIAVPVA